MSTTPAPAYLTAAEDRYDAMCRDEDATPEEITAATDQLRAATRRARLRALWEQRRAETTEPLQLHAAIPGLGWAVPVNTTDAAQTLEAGRLSLLVTRPAPGTLPAPIKL